MKKYRLTDETITIDGKTLYRIQALIDISGIYEISAGEMGGFIEKEENLSHGGNAWVRGNAKVFDNALVFGNALLGDSALICGNALVCGNAQVRENAYVRDNAQVFDNVLVRDDALICENALVCGHALICDSALICGNALVGGNAQVRDDAKVFGNALVGSNARVRDDARVNSICSVLVIGPIGSRGGSTTFYLNSYGCINVSCGCFTGSISDFEKAVQETHGESIFAKEYAAAIQLAKIHIRKNE